MGEEGGKQTRIRGLISQLRFGRNMNYSKLLFGLALNVAEELSVSETCIPEDQMLEFPRPRSLRWGMGSHKRWVSAAGVWLRW